MECHNRIWVKKARCLKQRAKLVHKVFVSVRVEVRTTELSKILCFFFILNFDPSSPVSEAMRSTAKRQTNLVTETSGDRSVKLSKYKALGLKTGVLVSV